MSVAAISRAIRRAAGVAAQAAPTWDLTVVTTAAGQPYEVNIASGSSVDITVDWGDGTVETYNTTGVKSHTYTAADTYMVRISGGMVGGNIQLGTSISSRSRLIATGVVSGVEGLANFYNTFYYARNLVSVPEDLFRYHPGISANAFLQTFSSCLLLAEIPQGLFRYNVAASTQAFRRTFFQCTSLQTLPEDLFRYNTAVSTGGFYDTFQACSNLASVPDGLFRYNEEIAEDGFIGTFFNCRKLQLNPWTFFAQGEEVNRFKNRAVNFAGCFYLAGAFIGNKGTAPALWSCDFGTQTPVKTNCFFGHSTDSVDNYASIPNDWKGLA